MMYDIFPIKNDYRGMGRLLLATDLYTKQFHKDYDYLLDKYYEYLSYVQESPSRNGLIKLITLCEEFSKYGILCEVIVYDAASIKSVFGYDLDLLGIDIVHDMSESLLCECNNAVVEKNLNQYGLCDSELDLDNIIPLLDHGDVKWEPCYVYKVKY